MVDLVSKMMLQNNPRLIKEVTEDSQNFRLGEMMRHDIEHA
jgi:hypothetical protein